MVEGERRKVVEKAQFMKERVALFWESFRGPTRRDYFGRDWKKIVVNGKNVILKKFFFLFTIRCAFAFMLEEAIIQI